MIEFQEAKHKRNIHCFVFGRKFLYSCQYSCNFKCYAEINYKKMHKTKGSREKYDYVVLHENYNIILKQKATHTRFNIM